jgi:hypothetical protein
MKSYQKILGIMAFGCSALWAQTVDPCTQTTQLNANAQGARTWTGTKSPEVVTGTGDDSRGVEIWTEAGNNNNLKVTWYGDNQGGGSAFRAEWTNSTDYLGRFGYFWGNNGKKWDQLGNLCVDYNYKTSGPRTGGSYSYIGIYGWTIGGNNSAEFYIVEDWFGNGQQQAANLGNNCQTHGNINVDGRTYQVVTCIRPQGSGCVGCNNQAFGQVFSIRQNMSPSTGNKCGTISISDHFKEWAKMTTAKGGQSPAQYIYGKTYEAKFLAEAQGGTGWFDASYMKFSRTGACYGGGTTPPQSSSSTQTPRSSSSVTPPRSSSSAGTATAHPSCTEYSPSFCGGAAFAAVTGNTTAIPTAGQCIYVGDFETIQPDLSSTISINGVSNTCGADWADCAYNTKPALKDGGYYVYVASGAVNAYQNNGWINVVAKPKPLCTTGDPVSSSSVRIDPVSSSSEPLGFIAGQLTVPSKFSMRVLGNKEIRVESNAQTVMEVFDLRGNKVTSIRLIAGSQTIKFALPGGIYFSKVKGVQTQKFILR